MSVEGRADALSLAPPGARCTVEGFTDWRASEYGWIQDGTGWMVGSEYLSELIEERHPEVDSSGASS